MALPYHDYINSPFKFLDPYELADKDIFFGRDQEINELYNLCFKTNLILLYGESGSGKTSIINCGLANKFEGPDWLPFFIRRDKNVNRSLDKALQPYVKSKEDKSVVEKIAFLKGRYFRPVYLIFDQLEELFIIGDPSKRKQEIKEFVNNIKTILDANLSCKVILILREEYVSHLYAFEKQIPYLFNNRMRVERMNEDAIKHVIEKSFHKFNISYEATHINAIFKNLSEEKSRNIPLPYLQVYLDTLYRAHYNARYKKYKYLILPPITLQLSIIEGLGNLDKVLELFFNRTVQNLSTKLNADYTKLPSNFVISLIDRFVTEEGTKRPIYLNENRQFDKKEIKEIERAFENNSEIKETVYEDAIEYLKFHRLLRDNDTFLELGHDSLAKLIDEQRTDEQILKNTVLKNLKYSHTLYERELENNSAEANLNNRLLSLGDVNSIKEFLSFNEHKEEDKSYLQYIAKSKKYHATKAEKEAQIIADKEKANLKAQLEVEKNKRLRLTSTIIGLLFLLSIFLGYQAWEESKSAKKESINADKRNVELGKSKRDDKVKTLISFKRTGNYKKSIETATSLLKYPPTIKDRPANLPDTVIYAPVILNAYNQKVDSLKILMDLINGIIQNSKKNNVASLKYFHQAEVLDKIIRSNETELYKILKVENEIFNIKNSPIHLRFLNARQEVIKDIEFKLDQAKRFNFHGEVANANLKKKEACYLFSSLNKFPIEGNADQAAIEELKDQFRSNKIYCN